MPRGTQAHLACIETLSNIIERFYFIFIIVKSLNLLYFFTVLSYPQHAGVSARIGLYICTVLLIAHVLAFKEKEKKKKKICSSYLFELLMDMQFLKNLL